MTRERWQQIKGVVEKVEDCAPADVPRFLHELCGDDAELRRQASEILAEGLDGEFIAKAIGTEAASLGEIAATQERFGPYQKVRRIGTGGMGTVYEAFRTDDFRKRVALKFIQRDIDSEGARERFQQERQVLAELEHPYIAHLLDGGETEDGRPFLVLEYVEGQPIDTYCAPLNREASLRLFLKVAEAVEYAHRKLVVHRDLKPANILVTPAGDPKLLDFGIAKLLDSDAIKTRTGFSALTPGYASPEQIRGGTITTASDVYSLGVVLYELLTGRKPYTLDTASPAEMDRVICEQPPAPPGLGDELDHILSMALRKEPDRRYSGVLRFAEDIERYLDHRPVSARPDTIRYRATKFLRRHWASVSAGAALLLSITLGLGFSMREARIANARFNDVRALATTFLFDFDREISAVPGNVKARAMLAATARHYLEKLSADAGRDDELLFQLATAYESLGDVEGMPGPGSLGQEKEGADSYRKAIALLERIRDRNPKYRLRLLQDRGRLARMVGEQGDQDAALELASRSAALADGMLAEAPGDVQRVRTAASSWLALATIQASMYQSEPARDSVLKSIALTERAIPRTSPPAAFHTLANGLARLVSIETSLDAPDAAEKAARRGLQIEENILRVNPSAANSRAARFRLQMSLAEIEYSPRYPSRNNPDEGARQWETSIAEIRQVIRTDPGNSQPPIDAVLSEANLTFLYLARMDAGDLARADRLSESMIAETDESLRKSPRAALLLGRLPLLLQARAAVLARIGRCDPALALSRDGVTAQRRLGARSADMRLDLSAPLLRHSGTAAFCGRKDESEAAASEAFGLIDGVAEQTGRFFSYAWQAANYSRRYAANLEAAAAKTGDKTLLARAAQGYERAASLCGPWQSRHPIANLCLAEAQAARARCIKASGN